VITPHSDEDSAYGEDMKPIRQRLSYANVTATIALFVALGGTSFALTLPRNSVGAAELKPDSVGRSEIRKGAVRSSELRDRAIRLRDIAPTARAALQGQMGPVGPPGPTFFTTISSVGIQVRGNATGSAPAGIGATVITFSRSMANCVPVATLTSSPGGLHPVPPAMAHVRAELGSMGRVVGRRYDPGGVPTDYPFNLVVAC
jgi:hypothetical protein